MNKINIGIFCRDFEILADWEYRLFFDIITNKSFVIQKIYQKNTSFKKQSLNDYLFKLFVKIENCYTNLPKINSKKKEHVINFFKKIPIKRLNVESKGYIDYFDQSISEEIKNENLDIILRHDFNIIKGNILNAPKYGIWSFHHGDTSKYRGGPSGFWEIINNEPITGSTLIKLNNCLDGGDIIDQAFYSTKKNFILNNYFIMDKSFKLVVKSLNFLINNKKINFKKQNIYKSKIHKSPNIINLLKYYRILSIDKFNKIKNRILKKIFKINSDIWTIVYDSNFEFNIDYSKSFKQKKSQFWADPFYISHKNDEYIFFENFNFSKGKGVISVGRLVNDNLQDIKDVVVRKYHLSYPQIFEYKNKILMTYESWQNNKCALLESKRFPYEWIKYKSYLEGHNAADPNFYNDGKNLWLFVNLSKDMINDHDSELYIFLVRNDFNDLIPHKLNPVITDSRNARNGGAIFKFNNKLIRPSQINIHDRYGFGLNLREIKKLNIYEYEEVDFKSFKFNQNSNFNGIHHISKGKKGFIFDRRLRYLY